MARIEYGNLISHDNQKRDYQIANINGYEVEVLQYLPVEGKLNFIQQVLQNTLDIAGFYNPIKLEVFFDIELIKAYTNIDIEDELENPSRLYDSLLLNDIIYLVKNSIPEEEWKDLFKKTKQMMESVVEFDSSILGILQSLSKDSSGLQLDAQKLIEDLKNSENLNVLREISEKM